MERIIFHLDVNHAFLAWTAVHLLNLGYPVDIRKIAAVIGGSESKRQGIVLAKSMLAAKKKIKTGEPLSAAREKCPYVEVFAPNYDLYQKMSHQLFSLIKKYISAIEVFSIDECFIDYTKVKNLYGEPLAFAHYLKALIKEELGFTVNIGIGSNKLTAKTASDFTKPDRVHTLFNEEIQTKMWPLPVIKLFGVGPKTSEKLNKLKIYTIKELAMADPNYLSHYFKNQASTLIEHAQGIDETPVIIKAPPPKGISHSVTLKHDLVSQTEALAVIKELVSKLTLKLKQENRYAQIIVVMLRDQYFNNYSHQRKLVNATNLFLEILTAATCLLTEMWRGDPLRLIGVRLEQLQSLSDYQLSLFDDKEMTSKEDLLGFKTNSDK